MHNIETVAHKLLRTYTTKFPFRTTGAREKRNLKEMKMLKRNTDEFEADDLSAFESDFMNIGKLYNTHQREVQKIKENIRRHIVRDKYFKEVQPSFLTFIEKDQIQRLHKSDPQEWTPEKLSKSFPALPETIRKILKSKWIPKSVETAVRYDNKVVENWKKFKTGKLIVNHDLNEHLMKFKHRKISLVNRELLLKTIIPPEIVLPKPTCSMFSNIINEVTAIEQSLHNQNLTSNTSNINSNEKELIATNKNSLQMSVSQTNKPTNAKSGNHINNGTQKKLVFTEFMKMKLQQLYETSPEEGITLLQTYNKYIESKNSENVSSNILNDVTKEESIEEKVVTAVDTLPNESTLIVNKTETLPKTIIAENTTDSSLDTYVKERNTSIDTKFKYTERIKIPTNVFKEGMTYRINDCYYDDDGEFLYRIPGIRN